MPVDHSQRLSRLPPAPGSPGASLVLLPPEVPEEDLPPRHWPEPPRTRWGGLLLVACVGVAGLFAWVRLGSEPTEPPAPMPAYAEGLGAMGVDEAVAERQELAAATPPVPPAPERDVAPVVESGNEQAAGSGAPAATTPQPREPEPEPEAAPPAATETRRDAARGDQPARDEGRSAPAGQATRPGSQPIPSVDRVALDAATTQAAAGAPAVGGTGQLATAGRAAEPPPRQPERPVERAPAPQVDLAAAQAALRQGAERFAGEVDRGATTGLRRMILASDGAAGDLVAFVEARKPDASVQLVGPATVEGDLARAEVRIGYAWRAEFGVTKRGTSSVQVLARLVDGTWTVAGVQPMTGPPR